MTNIELKTRLIPFFLLLLGSAVVVVVVLSIAGNPFDNSSLVNFREPDPQPNISLIEVEVSMDQAGTCRVFDDPDVRFYLDADVRFKLVNSGQEDGFAIIELTARNVVVDSNRYFVRADETQAQILSFEDLSCSITQEEINVRVTSVEGP